ncbi:MAG: organomercurial lyase, partial [Nitrospinota bacterium]
NSRQEETEMVDVSENTRRVRKLIVDSFVQTGRAPNVGEIGKNLNLSRHTVLEALRELPRMDTFWLERGTENIRILSPFSNIPTPYRVSVDGEGRWFAVCGPEALAMSFLFPGRHVEVDAYCRDCGEPIRLAMRDEELLEEEPRGLVVHLGVPIARWFEDLPFA